MRSRFEKFSGRSEYRLATLVLIGVGVSVFGLLLLLRPSWPWAALAFAVGGSSYLALVVLTYLRLRDADYSGWWLLPMVVAVHLGPSWDIAHWSPFTITFWPSALVSLVPLIIGWAAPRADSQAPLRIMRSR
jgi:uncharacterized membrane protein YhaH (DUF805 family)